MQYVNGAVGIVFLVLAALQLGAPSPHWSLCFLAGAALAFIALKRELNLWIVKSLAVASTGAMFWFFWGFFGLDLYNVQEWYNQEGSVQCMSLLIAGFCMIPILSDFSWRMKAAADHRIRQDRPLPGVRI